MSAKPPTEVKPPLDRAPAFSNISFQDPERARSNLARVAAHVSPALALALPPLLAEAPDPDSALALLDRLVSDGPPETVRLLENHHALAHYAIVVFGYSRFLGDTLIQSPDLLQSLLRDKNLDRSFSREEFQENLARFRSRAFETNISLLLTRFKRREYVRILLRDVLKISPLAETTAEISALSDVLMEAALREADNDLQRRYGKPQHLNADGRLEDTPFAVLSLGKLGGNELNYSSDIDLMYLFGDGTDPPAASISNREYFIRLAQQLTEILSQVTREGPVFRIDLRLRPQGNEGELAITLGQALRYYASTAHDWELQALIKVRYSAGSAALARQFIRGVQPYVYTEKLNFPAIKTALVAREKMQKSHRLRIGNEAGGAGIDVKIDRGGIRDIEFLVQCLQRVYGGAEPWLRSGGTLFSLQKLHDKRHINGKEFYELTTAYEFLRHLEHRLQLRQGQQTHRLPVSGPELQIVQRAMDGQPRHPEDFLTRVRQLMSSVADIYQRIIYQQQNQPRHEAPETEFQLRVGMAPGAVDYPTPQILDRLARDAPALYETASRHDLEAVTRKNLFRFLSAALTSSERYAVLLRHAADVPRALGIFEVSDLLTNILVRHPEEIATLAELGEIRWPAGSGYLFGSPLGRSHTADPVFAYLSGSTASYGEKLAMLRRHFRHRVLTTGAKDIAAHRDVYESLGESTAAAQDAISAAFAIADAPDNLAIMALGRLGSGEFDVLSDADVLFVCEQESNREELTRSASQIMEVLAAYTKEGMLFPVDTRLRPRGGEGELLVTPAQLDLYFEQEAQAWEALTYTKLRQVAGNRKLGERAIAVANTLFQRFAADPVFSGALREMRAKLENADAAGRSFKTSPGAIYDVDFLCSFLLVKDGIANKRGSLRDRLWRCAESGSLDKADAAALDHAAELMRTVDHVVRLVVGRARKWLPTTEHSRRVTEKLTAQILGRDFPTGLEAELEQNFRSVRSIYERVLQGPAG